MRGTLGVQKRVRLWNKYRRGQRLQASELRFDCFCFWDGSSRWTWKKRGLFKKWAEITIASLAKPLTIRELGPCGLDLNSQSFTGFIERVVPRTINSGSTVICFLSPSTSHREMLRNTVSAAVFPILRKGCRTVVRLGVW